MQVGDRIKAKIYYGAEGGGLLPPEWGTVVYIHPEGRFYTLEFNFPRGRFRESYWTAPPERLLHEHLPPEARPAGGWHRELSGALGKYLATL